MIKIKKSLIRGLHKGSKYYLQTLIAYIPLYLLIIALIYYDSFSGHFLTNAVANNMFVIVGLLLLASVRYATNGIHYQLLSKDITHIHVWQGLFKVFKSHLVKRTFKISFYKWLIGFVYFILPLLFTMAIISTGTINQLYWLILLVSCPLYIKMYYSYGFAQLLDYVMKKKRSHASCGIILRNNKLLMQGNKLKYLILQLILLIPRVLISALAVYGIWYMTNIIGIGVLAGLLVFVIITWIFIPYVVFPKLEFFKMICKQ